MCGIVGVLSSDGSPIVRLLNNGAKFVQHRGPNYAGFGIFDEATHEIRIGKQQGEASALFAEHLNLTGDLGIAHTRYTTIGEGGKKNAQPIWDKLTNFVLAHNGHITNTAQIAREFAERGRHFQTDNDAEPLAWTLGAWYRHFRNEDPSRGHQEAMFKAITEVQRRVTGAFSAVVATWEGLYAFRDPHGFRPMSRGFRESDGVRHFMVASETLPLEKNCFTHDAEVPRGGAFFLNREVELDERVLLEGEARPCAFETMYFAQPDSYMFGKAIRSLRWRAGVSLAQYIKEISPGLLDKADIVVPVPRSALKGAEAFAKEAGLDYSTAIEKYDYGGRTFLEESQARREEAAALLFEIDQQSVEGKSVFVIDDSIVRGTNSRRLVAKLYEAGAQAVYFGSLWPMVIDSCFQGIDTPDRKRLIGFRNAKDPEVIAKEIGAAQVFYLPSERFRKDVLKDAPACMACVEGQPATPFSYAGSVLPP